MHRSRADSRQFLSSAHRHCPHRARPPLTPSLSRLHANSIETLCDGGEGGPASRSRLIRYLRAPAQWIQVVNSTGVKSRVSVS